MAGGAWRRLLLVAAGLGAAVNIAITTVDLHLEQLQESMALDELDQGTFIIVSRNDRFISHPIIEMIMTSGLCPFSTSAR